MASTIATMAMINPMKLLTTPSSKPISLLSMHTIPKGLASTKLHAKTNMQTTTSSISIAGSAIAGAIFSSLGSCDAAFATQQLAQIAEGGGGGDNRGIALLLPIIPAIAWVLFNIFQPALNQINRMRSIKGVVIGLGLGLGGLLGASDASASEMAVIADAAAAATGSDNRGQLLLFVVAPAILWVLYNILQPALNQLNRMRSQ
ncbi:hypothetical protein TanjilG_32986 [Lupinus angustifolius]|uniref:Photosystem II core complex proteins psbY n=1 Tax=Lupinus angustifolius TaxID=3871 RepID=A0A4P1RN57_LUPAN|nr:PREDICTED: photosystem II core complex proteins psbY, chloroplastic-like [Lupinus angustifolius]OIW14644.1 hypothetical protein TanjilG_32986 [Lupinus angustifolius]